MINWSFFQKIYSCKFMSMIFKIILFLPIVDKHSKFYQTGILRDCVWIKYLPSYFLSSASHSKKETKIESLKLDNSICDTESYFQMQQILSIFKTSFNYDFLNPGFKDLLHDWNKMVQQICRMITRCSQKDKVLFGA